LKRDTKKLYYRVYIEMQSKRLTDKHGKALLDILDDKYFYNNSIVSLNTHIRFLNNTRIIYIIVILSIIRLKFKNGIFI